VPREVLTRVHPQVSIHAISGEKMRRSMAKTFSAATIVAALILAGLGFEAAQARSLTPLARDCQNTNFRIAVPACEKLLAQRMPSKTRASWLAVRGLAYHRGGNDSRAFDDFSSALRLDSRAWSALNARGLTYNDRNEFDKALDDLNAAIRIAPTMGAPYHNRGISWNAKGERDKAIADFNRAIELGIKTFNTYYGRGSAFFAQKKYDQAIADFDETLKRNPNYARAYNMRGAALREKGELKQAEAALSAAIRVDPTFATAYANRGFVYRRMNDYDRALRDYDEAIRLDPKFALAFFHRSIAHRLKGEINAAYRDIVRSLALNPDHKPSQHERGKLQMMLSVRPDKPDATANNGSPANPPSANPSPSHPPSASPTITPPSALLAQQSGPRVALVIGNAQYKFAPALLNPANDAQDMARALRDLGFRVIEGYDLDSAAMRAKIAEFGDAMPGAATTLFFYAGHGVQVAGRNYLVPTDARLARPSALNVEAIDVNTILADMETEKRTNLVFLDACRNNPLTRSLVSAFGRSRSAKVGQGLAQLNAGIGTLITFATSPNTVALDGQGRNSPFTAALLRHIGTPDVEIRSLLTRVRADVIKATQEQQIPWDHSSLVGEFYFRRGG